MLLVACKNIFLGLWKVKSEEVYRGLKINFSLFAQLGQMLIPIGKEKERKGKWEIRQHPDMIFFNVLLLTFNTEQCNFITNNRFLQVKMQQNWRKAPLNLFSKNKAWAVGGKMAAKCSRLPTHWGVQLKFFVILIHVWSLSSKLLLDLKPTTSTRYVIPWVNKCTLLLKVS